MWTPDGFPPSSWRNLSPSEGKTRLAVGSRASAWGDWWHPDTPCLITGHSFTYQVFIKHLQCARARQEEPDGMGRSACPECTRALDRRGPCPSPDPMEAFLQFSENCSHLGEGLQTHREDLNTQSPQSPLSCQVRTNQGVQKPRWAPCSVDTLHPIRPLPTQPSEPSWSGSHLHFFSLPWPTLP